MHHYPFNVHLRHCNKNICKVSIDITKTVLTKCNHANYNKLHKQTKYNSNKSIEQNKKQFETISSRK